MEKKHYIDILLVKDLMTKLHMDEKRLSELIGVTPPTVRRLLDGADQSHMRGDLIIKIARALDVPPHILIHKDYC